jgi:hypothetical protein
VYDPRVSVMTEIGPIALPDAPGRRSGFFTFEDEPLLAKYSWPYFIVAGGSPGPTVLITAGIHAAEYTGIEAAIRVGRSLDPARVRGTILIVPLLNRAGFFERSVYVNPEDNDNMNRVFPGDPRGTWSERFAHHLLERIVVRCDNAIDLHAGDMVEDLVPFVIYRETGDAELDARIRTMAFAYGLPWAVKSAPTGERPGSLYAVAAGRGVASMIAESGGRGLLIEEDVARHVRGVTNVLRAIGALEGKVERVAPPTVVESFDWVRSAHEGIFRISVAVGDRVDRGAALGEIVDLVGEPLARVTAPKAGVVLFVVTSPAIKKDGLLLAIGALP